ncbi:hypothetical protein BGZ93_009270 [Podila epicladia]|nr:hypothetical protein BGZ92_009952 [Podila epicladia]KAG0099076.1 hypothetical protein BGZ93_009270 [Podila epicladia]
MNDDCMELLCLVDAEATSKAFSIEVPLSGTVSHLKNLIKLKKSDRFSDVAPKDLTLWHVSIPNDNQGSTITIDGLDDKGVFPRGSAFTQT